jgi:prepilin signal peptidase PulO-like enzyme (type II secretory pathway)
MKITKHCERRMNQRGHTKKMIKLAMEIGEAHGEKYVTNKKIIKVFLADLDQKIKRLSGLKRKFKHLPVVFFISKAITASLAIRGIALKVLDKGGVTVVCEGTTLITAYNTDSFNRRLYN